MSDVKHTAEPWRVGDKVGRAIYGADYSVVAMCDSMEEAVSDEGNARRIVAAVNACAAISTERLEMLGPEYFNRCVDILRECEDGK